MYKGTVIHTAPEDVETIRFTPSWHNNGIFVQSVAVCPLKDREVSIIMDKGWSDGKNYMDYEIVHLVFTEEETDLLINALVEAKKRWNDDSNFF